MVAKGRVYNAIAFAVVVTIFLQGVVYCTPPNREGRLLVTTTTVSATSSTSTFCYTTTAAVTACARKRRGIINDQAVEFEDDDEIRSLIAPEKPSARTEEQTNEVAATSDLNSGLLTSKRDDRAFLYVITTTETSVSYSTTTTYTVTFGCTPASSVLSICG